MASFGTGIVTNAQLGADAVSSDKIADGSIVNADINASAAIAGSKLQALSVGSNAGVIPSTGLVDAHIASGSMISGSKLAHGNLCAMYSTNVFTETINGSAAVVSSTTDGTLQLISNADGADASIKETDAVALSLLPRILTFSIRSLTLNAADTIIEFGLINSTNNHWIWILTSDSGANWKLRTYDGGTTDTAIAAPVAGDVFTFYCTSARISVFKNNTHIATHTTNIPAGDMRHMVSLFTIGAGSSGSQITLDYIG